MKNKKIKLSAAICIVIALLIPLIIWIAWGNKALMLTEIKVESDKIPEAFSGYRIAQVSDLHNAEFGEGNEKLLSMLKDADPDIIAVTGDIIDSRRTDADIAASFMKKAMDIAPCYFVTGNHEERASEAFEKLESAFEELGVVVLRNETAVLEKAGERITVAGLDDPDFEDDIGGYIVALSGGDDYTILLSHRPEYFDVYIEHGMDLVLSGHAHGGQVRLPLAGGVIAPGQGLFPEYTEGIYTEGSTSMIVSRGLGNSLFPFRVNNRPEVVLVELSGKE